MYMVEPSERAILASIWSQLAAGALVLLLLAAPALANNYLRSPDRSVQADLPCEFGSVDDRQLTCIASINTSVNLGKRLARDDYWRGIGNAMCKAKQRIKLHANGYLADCTLHLRQNFQRRDGTLPHCKEGDYVRFDDEGFLISECSGLR